MALDVEIGRPASFVGQPQAYVSIRDTIRTCAKGVAEGFALQAFAQMPMGQGRVGVFLFLASILKYLITTSARGLGLQASSLQSWRLWIVEC